MKRAAVWSPLIFCLLVFGLGCCANAENRKATTKKSDKPAPRSTEKTGPVVFREKLPMPTMVYEETISSSPDTWYVRGQPGNIEETKKSAYQQAHLEVQGYLRSQHPPLECPLEESFVRKKLVKEFWLEEDDKLKVNEDPDIAAMKIAVLKISITPADREALLAKDRQYRMVQRMTHLAKILGGLMIVCVVVAGFVHLDEKTKGYFTRWLIIGSVCLVSVAVIAMLVIR